MFDEPKDMFSGIDEKSTTPGAPMPAAAPALTPPPSAMRPPAPAAAPISAPAHRSRGGVVLILLLVAVLVGGAAAYAMYRFYSVASVVEVTATQSTDAAVDTNELLPIEPTVNGGPIDPAPSGTILDNAAQFLDSDGDGLSNSRELELGTFVGKPDSDSDGLGDKEEVDIYNTDPLKADTDGDTFADGVEVRGGYNPVGPGKLQNVPTAIPVAPITTTVPTIPGATTPQPPSTPTPTPVAPAL